MKNGGLKLTQQLKERLQDQVLRSVPLMSIKTNDAGYGTPPHRGVSSRPSEDTAKTPDLEDFAVPRYPKIPLHLAEKIKRRHCFMSQDIERDRELHRNTCAFVRQIKVKMSARGGGWCCQDMSGAMDGGDGEVVDISIDEERFEIPEFLIHTQDIGSDFADAIESVFSNVAMDDRRKLLQSAILSGGGSLIPGTATRFLKELKIAYATRVIGRPAIASNLQAAIVAGEERDLMPFNGLVAYARDLSSHV